MKYKFKRQLINNNNSNTIVTNVACYSEQLKNILFNFSKNFSFQVRGTREVYIQAANSAIAVFLWQTIPRSTDVFCQKNLLI